MNSSLDLNLLLLAQQGGVESSELPDLYAVTPPRRAARGRETDSLIIYLSMVGNSPLTPQAYKQLLEEMAQKFYKTSGSLTAALRTVAEALNLYLLDRNLRSTSAGRQGIGQLLLVALRADMVYIAESGVVRALLVTPQETQPLYDLQTSGRGLGLSRSLPLRFLQIKLAADDYLLLSTIAASGWSDASIKHPAQQGMEALQRQVMGSAGQEFNAVIIQAQSGTGKLKLLKRKTEPVGLSTPLVEAQPIDTVSAATANAQAAEAPGEDHGLGVPAAPIPVSGPVEPSSQENGSSVTSVLEPAPVPVEQPSQDKGLGLPSGPSAPSTNAPLSTVEPSITRGEREQPVPSSSPAASQSSTTVGTAQSQSARPRTDAVPSAVPIVKPASPVITPAKNQPIPRPRPWMKYLIAIRSILTPIIASIGRALGSALSTIGAALLRLFKNLLPDADVLRLPPSTMVFIAIAIPLVLAVIGGIVFLQRGQTQQQQIYYQQAVEKAAYAATLTNPLEQRFAWQTALGELDKAEQYVVTSQSQELRSQVTASLDALDSVKRLDYKQAIVSGLESGVNVTRIVASAADLYLLNGAQGNVFHAVLTGRGYELDPSFQCGPTNGPINVGPLVDIAELPPGGYENASLLGVDANGNLLYCVVGSQPYSASLAAPNTGLGEPIGLSIDRGDLFVLDPKVNAVWIYRNMEVSQPPRLYFGDTIPPMQDVIDMAVYNDDLFLLHADGHTTKCVYSGMAQSPTRCDDPFPYSDNRPGRVHGPVIEDGAFTQIFYASFPERSIFYLEPRNQAIFYFSVQLTLQWQYQPKTPLANGDATAFAISPNHIAFLAIANNVYYAAMP
jgi:hypothetical protein